MTWSVRRDSADGPRRERQRSWKHWTRSGGSEVSVDSLVYSLCSRRMAFLWMFMTGLQSRRLPPETGQKECFWLSCKKVSIVITSSNHSSRGPCSVRFEIFNLGFCRGHSLGPSKRKNMNLGDKLHLGSSPPRRSPPQFLFVVALSFSPRLRETLWSALFDFTSLVP